MILRVRATIVQAPAPGRLDVLDDHVVEVDDTGTISAVRAWQPGDHADVTVPAGSYLMPGMIDTHLHAPQWPQLGIGLDLPLERWLFEYTFPLEERFADTEFAGTVWNDMVPRLLSLGTTTAVYYGSIHEEATLALAATCAERGQRAFVGRVAMDHPEGTPDWYRDMDAMAAVDASARSAEAIVALDSRGLVEPIITPRFAPACTDAALQGLAELAATAGHRVQTHCSESDWQHGYAFERFGESDAAALDRFGLLRDHTVLAHATHLDDNDRTLLRQRGAGVAHCPLSNSYFANAVFPARRHIDTGVRVGLGTDVAGGPTASMLDQCGHAVTSSRMLEDGVDPGGSLVRPSARIDTATAIWMATAGGADLLGIPAGLLEPGRVFDAIEVTPPNQDWVGDDDPPTAIERIVRDSAGRRVGRVWVDGRDVVPA